MGLVVYGGLVAWSLAFMRQAFPFVLPGAAVGAYLQTVRGRPVLGAICCLVIVVAVPALLWPAGLTGVFADLTNRF